MLIRNCRGGDAGFRTSGLSIEGGNHDVVLFASVPLSTEPWQPLEEGRLVVVRDGIRTP